MSGNTIGSIFRVTTWGESHGKALGAVVDGCPPGLDLDEADIQKALDRRKPSMSVSSTTRQESDKVEILSGVFEGKTTGTPVSLIIKNTDAKSSSYNELKNIFRPGQGDFSYLQKYGIRDWRGGGRSSGRETAARVAAGAIAEKVIVQAGMDVIAYTQAIGTIAIDRDEMPSDKNLKRVVHDNSLFCPDLQAAAAMEKKITAVRKKGDSLGGVVGIIVRGCPAGLGEPVFDKMDADLAKALMSIGSVKAVEIGDGMEASRRMGSEVKDQMNKKWWELAEKYQGIVPPTVRDEVYCDASTKTHINDTPAYYYNYAVAKLVQYQLHNYISKNILKQNPHYANYYNSKETGQYLLSILEKGKTVNWRSFIKEKTGEELSASGMIEYFQPLMDWLKKENAGRKIGW